MALSVAYAVGLVLFALATLPVELGASHRALTLLRGAGLADAEETGEVRSVAHRGGAHLCRRARLQLCMLLALVLIAVAARGPRDVSGTPDGVAKQLAHEPTTARPPPSSLAGVRIFQRHPAS